MVLRRGLFNIQTGKLPQLFARNSNFVNEKRKNGKENYN